MHNLNIFIPITKVDEEKRLVYGTVTEEVLDKSGEMFDYDSSKPYFEQWSGEFSKATGGKSLGNVRVMHSAKVAGKIVELEMDDVAKRITCAAKIIDDAEWKMCLEGAYTGFSQGGKYVRRWTDDAGVKRYTASPSEISVVDNPCLHTAHFECVKADGTIITKEFKQTMSDKNPSGDEVVAKAKEMAEAAGRKSFKDFLYKARQELLDGGTTVIDTPDLNSEIETDLVKSDVEPDADVATEGLVIDPAAALIDALAKAAAAAEPTREPASPMADLKKSAAALVLLAGKAETDLAKGMYTVCNLAQVIDQVANIQASCAWEAEQEGDNSPVPAELAASVAALCANLVHMVAEETAEIIAAYAAQGMDIDFDPNGDGDSDTDDAFAFAASIVDLVKADTALMEKAGARNSKADVAKVQEVHDAAVALGAHCNQAEAEHQGAEEDHAKAALLAENDRLAKALADAAPAVELITKAFGDKLGAMESTIETLTKRLEQVESEPAAPKAAAGAHRTITKSQDVNPTDTPATGITSDDFQKALASLPEAQRGELLLKVALASPQIVKR